MSFSLRGVFPGRILTGSARIVFLAGLLWSQTGIAQLVSLGQFADSPAWTRLLHYSRAMTGHWQQDEGPRFHISPSGNLSPISELEASIAAIKAGDPTFECRFPARALVLRRVFSSLPQSKVNCMDWQAFKSRVSAKKAAVVFSGYYLNNPASAFGHTFLVLGQQPSKINERRLLDFGVSYAARVDTTNSMVYAFKGTFGLFKGEFTGLPVYYKVREYADAESRDLWFFNLALTPEELELLVAHIWEMSQTDKGYYYFSRNCSYELIALIQAIRPQASLLERLPWFILPSHTLQIMMSEPGLVESQSFSPSARHRLEARLDKLSAQERQLVPDADLTALDRDTRARVLDARVEWIDFKHFRELTEEEPKVKAFKQETLEQRAATGIIDRTTIAEPSVLPTEGHLPRRLRVGLGKDFAELAFRPALQDLLDPSLGYPPLARLEFTQLRVRLNRASGATLEEISLFRAESLSPLSRTFLAPSWKVGLSDIRQQTSLCRDEQPACLALQFDVGGGGDVELLTGPKSLNFFAIGTSRLLSSTSFSNQKLVAAAGAEAGAHLRIRGFGKDRLRELAALTSIRWDRLSLDIELGASATISRMLSIFINTSRSQTQTSQADSWQLGTSYYF